MPEGGAARSAAWAVAAVAVWTLFSVQFMIPTLWEADGYYHTHMAETVRREGFVREFHWARYSLFARQYADKDLLYHVLLVPFTFFSKIFFGVKLAAALFSCALLLTFFWLLRRVAAAPLVPAFLAMFLLSGHFLAVLARPRPLVPAIALMIVGIHACIAAQPRRVFLTALVYGYLHITAPLLVGFALLIELLRLFETEAGAAGPAWRNFRWKTVAAAAAGVGTSLVFHPNFPNNLRVVHWNLFLVPIYAAKGGVLELGAEFFPLSTRDFFLGYPLLLPAMLGLIFWSMTRPQAARFETKALFACAVPFFLGSLISQRYIVHGYPLLLLWLAAHWTDLGGGRAEHWAWAVSRRGAALPLRFALLTLAVLSLLWAAKTTAERVRGQAAAEFAYNRHYEAVGEWMRKNIPPGEVVFHANWSDSQYFIGLNPQDDYFVTLDPIYMYEWNPDLYRIYRDVAHARIDPYPALRQVFNVRYGYAGKNYFSPLISRISRDPRFQILAEDGLGVIFRLR